MDISFKLDPEVYIGADTLCMAGTIASRHGSRIMIAADNGLEKKTLNRLKEILEDSKLSVIIFDGIESESSVEMAESVAELSCAAHCDAIIGFGGQKAQIIARLAAIMAPMTISAFELLDGRVSPNIFLPVISIPTEGASAFSFTGYFIVTDPRSRLIKSIQSPVNLYSAVIIDSSLFKFNSANAAAFVLEGLFCAVEAYCSAKANFLSDSLLERALTAFAKILRTGAGSAGGISAQAGFDDSFAQAGFLASFGCLLSSPGIGAALSAAVSARAPITSSQCSAAMFPVVAQRLTNARPEKMARLATLLGAPKAASVADTAKCAVDAIRRCMEILKVPAALKEYNIPLDRMAAAAETARNMDFVSNSP